MKIAVISAQVFPVPPVGYSGLEMIAYHCAKGLAARGHQVVLFAPDGSVCPGAQVIHTGPAGWDEKMAYGGVPNQRDGYWKHLPMSDVVIDHSWQKWSYQLRAEGQLKAPVLGVCHAPINTMFQSPPPIEKPCIVCISQDQKVHYESLFSPAKARVAYNGIDLTYYKPLQVPRSDRFLFLARFSTIKGPDIAIEACLKAGVGLDLVGDTSITNEPELFAKCQSMADDKQIKVHGGVSRGETVWWYSQAHAMIHPNMRFREPFGLAPVEAMACGCPVIGWDYGAMRETVAEGGSLVSHADQLIPLIKQYTKLNEKDSEYRRDNREQASRFSLENMVSGYESLCHEAIETGGW